MTRNNCETQREKHVGVQSARKEGPHLAAVWLSPPQPTHKPPLFAPRKSGECTPRIDKLVLVISSPIHAFSPAISHLEKKGPYFISNWYKVLKNLLCQNLVTSFLWHGVLHRTSVESLDFSEEV